MAKKRTDCEDFSVGFTEKAGTSVSLTEKEGGGVTFTVKAGDSVSFSEKSGPATDFTKAEEWDWREFLSFCDSLGLSDLVDSVRTGVIDTDSISLTEAWDIMAQVLEADSLALTENEITAVEKFFADSVPVSENEVTSPFVRFGNTLGASDGLSLLGQAFQFVKVVHTENLGLASQQDFKTTSLIKSDNPPTGDDAAFAYGHGGYGELSYGAST